MTKLRHIRLPSWLVASALCALAAACATDTGQAYEQELSSGPDAGTATLEESLEEDPVELGSTQTALSSVCSFDAQCGLGKRCVDGACQGASGGSCASDNDCSAGKQCRAGSCQKTDAAPNNPCDFSAARSFGYMICKRLHKGAAALTACLQQVDRDHNCWGARTSVPTPAPGPQCTSRNDVCSTQSDCCSGLTCRGGGFHTFKTCQ